MIEAIDALVGVLASAPTALMPTASMGTRTPDSAAGVPALVVSLVLDPSAESPGGAGAGLGRLVREDEDRLVEPRRQAGSLVLELWAASFPGVDALARKLQAALESSASRLGLRQAGFLRLRPVGLGPAEGLWQATPAGSAFAVWKQRLTYVFVFEGRAVPDDLGGGPIRRIDVDLPRPGSETFSVS